jgi:hypothetical protein
MLIEEMCARCLCLFFCFNSDNSELIRTCSESLVSSLREMKCLLSVTIAFCIAQMSHQLDSLNAVSLIAPQIDFLEEMCFNRTGNEKVFEDLQSTLFACQSTKFNGTELSLSYNTLVYTSPEVFYNFYLS